MTVKDIKRICQIYDNLRRERDAATIAYNSEDTFWEYVLATYNLSQPSLPSNLDEAAEEYAVNHQSHDIFDCYGNPESDVIGKRLAFMAGAKWADVHSQELSLPSNLDEAARKYGHEEPILPEGYNDGDIPLYERWTADAFKAGAEWMARQGYIKEGIARPDDCEIWINFTDTDIKDGDKVIVQIRKKQ